MIILVRVDLAMPAGKLGSQVAHVPLMLLQQKASYSAAGDGHHMSVPLTEVEYQWLSGEHFPKVLLEVKSEHELLATVDKAKLAGLPAIAVKDQGRTFFSEPTWTVAAIGPATSAELKPITGRLRLYKGE